MVHNSLCQASHTNLSNHSGIADLEAMPYKMYNTSQLDSNFRQLISHSVKGLNHATSVLTNSKKNI